MEDDMLCYVIQSLKLSYQIFYSYPPITIYFMMLSQHCSSRETVAMQLILRGSTNFEIVMVQYMQFVLQLDSSCFHCWQLASCIARYILILIATVLINCNFMKMHLESLHGVVSFVILCNSLGSITWKQPASYFVQKMWNRAVGLCCSQLI